MAEQTVRAKDGPASRAKTAIRGIVRARQIGESMREHAVNRMPGNMPSQDDIQKVLEAPPSKLQRFWLRQLNHDRNKWLEKHGKHLAMKMLTSSEQVALFERVYSAVDVDSSGILDTNEVSKLLHALYIPHSYHDLEQLMAHFKSPGSCSFSEFVWLLCHSNHRGLVGSQRQTLFDAEWDQGREDFRKTTDETTEKLRRMYMPLCRKKLIHEIEGHSAVDNDKRFVTSLTRRHYDQHDDPKSAVRMSKEEYLSTMPEFVKDSWFMRLLYQRTRENEGFDEYPHDKRPADTFEHLSLQLIHGILSRLRQHKKLIWDFMETLDQNRDGSLSRNELGHGLRMLSDINLSQDDISMLLEYFDHNHDGKVDYHELYDALMSEQDDGNTNDAAHHTCSKVDVPLALDPAVTHSQPSPHALRLAQLSIHEWLNAQPSTQPSLADGAVGSVPTDEVEAAAQHFQAMDERLDFCVAEVIIPRRSRTQTSKVMKRVTSEAHLVLSGQRPQYRKPPMWAS